MGKKSGKIGAFLCYLLGAYVLYGLFFCIFPWSGPPSPGAKAARYINRLRSIRFAGTIFCMENDKVMAYRVNTDLMSALEPYSDHSIDIAEHPVVMSVVEGAGVFVGLDCRFFDKKVKEKFLNMARNSPLTNSYGRSFDGRENVVFIELPRQVDWR